MATGQYPEDHGIVGDFMYDLKSQTLFNASDISSTKYAFWVRDKSETYRREKKFTHPISKALQ